MKLQGFLGVLVAMALVACDREKPPPPPRDDAEMAYRTACATCHQWDGRGIVGFYPPLAGTEWVRMDDPGVLIRIILHGMVGPVTVNGEVYQTSAPIMPGQGPMLPDDRIARIVGFVLNEFGDQNVEVTEQMVRQIRDAEKDRSLPWTEKELLQGVGGF
jgi:mono/diheme cytochrome c family protein